MTSRIFLLGEIEAEQMVRKESRGGQGSVYVF